MSEVESEGWAFPWSARKAHYFVGAFSLCRKWMFTGALTRNQMGTSPDDCVQCSRLLTKRSPA